MFRVDLPPFTFSSTIASCHDYRRGGVKHVMNNGVVYGILTQTFLSQNNLNTFLDSFWRMKCLHGSWNTSPQDERISEENVRRNGRMNEEDGRINGGIMVEKWDPKIESLRQTLEKISTQE